MEFPQLKKFLTELKFPNIKAKNDEEIAEIFSADNRIFLLTWLFEHLEYNSSEFGNETKLCDILEELGFCTASEKKKFINCDMEFGKQMEIFFRIFTTILTLKKHNESGVNSLKTSESSNLHDDDPITPEQLRLFKSGDINLFPQYGALSTRTKESRLSKMAQCEEDLENLKRQIEEELQQQVVHSEENKEPDDELIEIYERLPEAVEKVKEDYVNASRFFVEFNKGDEGKLPDDFKGVVTSCCENLRAIGKHLEVVKLASGIKGVEIDGRRNEKNKLVFAVKQQYNLSKDVVNSY